MPRRTATCSRSSSGCLRVRLRRRAAEVSESECSPPLARRRGLVACVVARDVDVGIDVERVGSGTDIIDLARRHFSSAEVAELERCESGARAARFTELWTLKESYVKATGAGILRGLDECAFTL